MASLNNTPTPVAYRRGVPMHRCIETCGRLVPWRPRICSVCSKAIAAERDSGEHESLTDFRRRLKGSKR